MLPNCYINQDWLQCNIKHEIDVGIQHVCALHSMSLIRIIRTRSFALVTIHIFLIIATLCTYVAGTIVCDCFLLLSLC